MSKPLIANKKRKSEESAFHSRVFSRYAGPKKLCYFCGRPGATDAAHVIGKAHLGPLRFSDERLARPAHRECHEAQTRNEIDWAFEIRLDAVRAHNEISKVKLQEPSE